MIIFTGNVFLYISLLSCLVGLVSIGNAKRISYEVASFSPILAYLILLICFILGDYQVKNIFFNSSSIMPIYFRVAASWASHEGSMMLWIALLSIMSRITYKLSGNNAIIITTSTFVQLLFITFIIFTSNPFEIFRSVPSEGMGMNPVLQDIALTIHPPILYLGYACFYAMFLVSLAILECEAIKLRKLLSLLCKLALFFSSLAIGLGSWWAYRELGWGGYWFFDPVENISLMPWLIAIASHHLGLISKTNSNYFKLNILLAMSCFCVTIFGFFIVRSGIISSVHSFAYSGQKGLYLIIITLIICCFAMLSFLFKQNNLNYAARNIKGGRANIIIAGSILWCMALIIILISLFYPLYYVYFFAMDIAIDPSYFHVLFIPIFIPLLALASLAGNYLPKKIHLIALLISGVIFYHSEGSVVSFVILYTSINLIIAAVIYYIQKTAYFTISANSKILSVTIGHFGFGLLALAICLNSLFSSKLEFSGIKGGSARNEQLSAKINEIKFADHNQYYRQIVTMQIRDNLGNEIIVKPENRLYKIENSLSQEADIYSFVTHDILSIASSNKDQQVHAIIYFQPMISFIWLAILLISLSFIINLRKFS